MKLYPIRQKNECINYEKQLMEGEHVILNGSYSQWTDTVKHLGNYIGNSNTDDIDCNVKRSMFM